ncbi:DNA-formamidopyrimidine glycosylase family protein [Rhodococcus zopfii]|uniref:DNA-formamidopyrimidine glycosylase family protein n=1 Tax=Rhodococcus zopfii TaxID=43772 RepID=UPI00364FA182
MPEGDTVYRTAARLQAALSGKTLTRSDFRVPRYATVDLSGAEVTGTVACGKHLLTRLPEHTVHTHLMMDGEWQVYARGARWRKPAFRARLILETADVQAVGFDLGIVEVLPRDRESDAIGHLGPDLLGPLWDPDPAAANLARDPARPIGLALLDQRVLAGIGNVYRSELCFLRGVHPGASVADAGDPAAWVDLAHRLLVANRDRAVRVTTGDRRPGRNLWVYGRAGQPCRRCGTIVVSGSLGASTDPERVFYRCPSCQPGLPGQH